MPEVLPAWAHLDRHRGGELPREARFARQHLDPPGEPLPQALPARAHLDPPGERLPEALPAPPQRNPRAGGEQPPESPPEPPRTPAPRSTVDP
ncbi:MULTISPECIES: hypothetical protein [unclassified Amycolatopsis]|uniref:hypothetical protein n=1 Tax=unclassified Amycolatopsis TaxID=2618356 RepID=UPI0028770624|nr:MULTISPECIES: hypothetical protein [unclassified Amycolatopsis]MDS0134381.1 hypothetical protein [Amycolatopsis sp. 505]MDS0148965.1 hypothetical protein [Amycolatopsis sp. CM201R]